MAYIKNKELYTGTMSCMTALACLWANTMQKGGRRAKQVLRQELMEKENLLDGPKSIVAPAPKELPLTFSVVTQTACSASPQKSSREEKQENSQYQNKEKTISKLLNNKFTVHSVGNCFVLYPVSEQKSTQESQQPNSPKEQEKERPPNLALQSNQKPPKVSPLQSCLGKNPPQQHGKSTQTPQNSLRPCPNPLSPQTKCPKPKTNPPPPSACLNPPQTKFSIPQQCLNKCLSHCKLAAQRNQLKMRFRCPSSRINIPQKKISCLGKLNQGLLQSKCSKQRVSPSPSYARQSQIQQKIKSPQQKCNISVGTQAERQWCSICT